MAHERFPFRLKSRYGKTVARYSYVRVALVNLCNLTLSSNVPDVTHYRVVDVRTDRVLGFADYDTDTETWNITIRRYAWAAENSTTKSSKQTSSSQAAS